MTLKVNEIFYSIQGESSFAGLPCVFIRLSGCNLRCSYCDTQYAYDEGNSFGIEEILEQVASYSCPLVEVTGGEPLLQNEAPLLIFQLLEKGYQVLLETNGSQDINQVDNRCIRILDIKCPSSGESDQNDLTNLKKVTEKDEIKFVIANREDFDFAKNIIENWQKFTKIKNPILFSSVFGKIDPQQLAEWILGDHLIVRLQVQLHKLLWSPDARGV